MPIVKEAARDTRIGIRIPSALRDALEREATAQRRSLSDTIVLLLTDALAKRGKGR